MIEIPILTPSKSVDDLSFLLTVTWGFVPGRVLETAINAGFFKSFPSDLAYKLSIDDITLLLKWDSSATLLVINILNRIGLVELSGDNISLTQIGKKWFHPDSLYNLSPYFDRKHKLEMAYDQLSIVLATGEPNNVMVEETSAAFGMNHKKTEDFVLTMHASALTFGPKVIKELTKLKNQDETLQFLDVGCGPGTLSCIAQDVFSNSHFRAFDLCGVIEFTKLYIAKAGKSNSIKLNGINWNEWDWLNQNYDVIFLSQVLHEVSKAEAERLFYNAAKSLKQGGLLVVVMVGNGIVPGGDLLHSIFSLNVCVETGGYNISLEWIESRICSLSLETVIATTISGGRSLWIGKKNG